MLVLLIIGYLLTGVMYSCLIIASREDDLMEKRANEHCNNEKE